MNHLFFECEFATGVWHPILQMMGFNQQGRGFQYEWQLAATNAHSKRRRSMLYVMLFTEVVYTIWIQRNNKIFRGSCLPTSQVMKEMFSKASASCKDSDRILLLRNNI